MVLIEKYFPNLEIRQHEQLTRLDALYKFWNQRVNVISRKDIENLYLHHVLHSLSIAKIITFNPDSTVIDAGTGGGFPGIPLAILFPRTRFVLTDSISKKIRVVETIIKETGLNNCTTRNMRLEDLKDHADFVVCRAVAEIPELYGWIRKNVVCGGSHLLKNGLLALKGGDLTGELKSMGKEVQVFDLKDHFAEPFFETKKLVHVPCL
jgi:16S rRNA (guanine527-N7)-methyltransferase